MLGIRIKVDKIDIPVKPLTQDEKIAKLEQENISLQNELAQTNNDFLQFMDFYFSSNPEL